MKRTEPSVRLALLLGALVAPCAAQVTGVVVDAAGAPVAGALVDAGLPGIIVGTGATGVFALGNLPPRTYTLSVTPPTTTLAPARFQATVGTTGLSPRLLRLEPGMPIRVKALDAVGLPLAGGVLQAYTPEGQILFTPGNAIGGNGLASIVVPAHANVMVRITPPPGAALVPFLTTLAADAPIDLGTVALQSGFRVTGAVVDAPSGVLPVSGCRLTTIDASSRAEVHQLQPLSSALGFSLLLPTGLFDIEVVPPSSSRYVARTLRGVPVTAGVALTAPLQRGEILSAHVAGPAGPVVGADVVAIDAAGHAFASSTSRTDAAGLVQIVVPAGTYTLRVTPPAASGLVGATTAPWDVAAETDVGTVALAAGVPVALDVVDAAGAPVVGATLELRNAATGAAIPIVAAVADAQGRIRTTAPQGILDVHLAAPQGSGHAPLDLQGLIVVAPIQTVVALQPKVVSTDLATVFPGVVLSIPNGAALPVTWTIANRSQQPQNIVVDGVHVDGLGATQQWVPPVQLPLPAGFAGSFALSLPTPALPPAERTFEQRFQVRVRDAATGALLDRATIGYVVP